MAGMPGPPLEERAQLAIACSCGRIVCNRLTTAPGPDPVPPAAHLRASTVQAGHPVVASTAACGRRLGGGPARDGLRHLPRPRSSTDRGHGVTPHSLRPNYSAQTSRVPRNVAVRARALRQRSRALSGTFFVIKSGSDLAIGPTISLFRRCSQESGDLVVNYVCRDRADHLWQFGMRSKPACRPRRTAVRGYMLIDTRKPGRTTCGLRKTCRSVG